MNETIELILKIAGLIIAAVGVFVVFAAPKIVDKKGLAEKKEDDPRLTANMTDEEKIKFKRQAAIVDVKLRGLLIAAPGFIMILIAFR